MDKAIEEDPNGIGVYDLKIGDYSGALADITMSIEFLEKHPWDNFVRHPKPKKKCS